MFRRITCIILIMTLVIACISAACASEPGLFAELSKSDYGDKRLTAVDQVAEPVSVSLVTDDGTAVEICQAYYEGNRVFVSYKLSRNTGYLVCHEGIPDREIEWLITDEWCPGDTDSFGDPYIQKENDWLDGKSRHWLETCYYHFEKDLELEDGTAAEWFVGEEIKQEDGSWIGWKECLIPEEKAEDTLTFCLILSGTYAVKFQDYSTFSEYWENMEAVRVPFTLKRHNLPSFSGSFETGGYKAEAVFTAGLVDLQGTVTLTGVSKVWTEALDRWYTDFTMPDMICGWTLYDHNMAISSEGLSFSENAAGSDSIVFRLMCDYHDPVSELLLCPVYSTSGEHTDEAFTLKPVSP